MVNGLLRFHAYFNWLYQNRELRLKFAVSHGLFIFLFLLLFLPFGSSQNNLPNWLFLALYFLSFGIAWATSLMLLDSMVTQPKIDLEKIDLDLVKKDLGIWIVKLLVIHSIFFLLFALTCKDCFTLRDYFEIQYANFLMFLFSYVGFSLFAKNEYFKYKIIEDSSAEVTIKGQGRGDLMKVPLNQLVYMKANDNYSEVFYRKGGSLVKKILRVSITGLEQQFRSHENISRTHRSYMVNSHYLSYQTKSYVILMIGDEKIQIPLSSTYASTIKK